MKDNKVDTIKILIADDHTLFMQGLKKILDMENDMKVCGEAENGEEVIDKVKSLKPHIVVMDINMPLLNGVEATRVIKKEYPEVKVIALTIHDDEEYLFEIIKEGASGYILKDVDTPYLTQGIREVAGGNCLIHPSITHKLIGGLNRIANNFPDLVKSENSMENELTNREKEVLGLMAKGYNNNDISEELSISEKTVKNHVASILGKLEVSDRTKAVITVLKQGIVQLS